MMMVCPGKDIPQIQRVQVRPEKLQKVQKVQPALPIEPIEPAPPALPPKSPPTLQEKPQPLPFKRIDFFKPLVMKYMYAFF